MGVTSLFVPTIEWLPMFLYRTIKLKREKQLCTQSFWWKSEGRIHETYCHSMVYRQRTNTALLSYSV